ncbi:MAG: hypothetical protein HOO67_01505 [Candidatus Peribacteraceae bacterium]|nr:hypothetical protein [Candidatus Peribacteraceae bacterium]
MNEEHRKLIEAKDGIILKTERRDTRNRFGECGWLGTQTTFLLAGIIWEHRTGQVFPTRHHPASYNRVVSYDDKLPKFESHEATDFFNRLVHVG